MTLAVPLFEVRERISRAAQRTGREPREVTLVAVAKGHSPEAARVLYDAGHRDFGESRARDLEEKAAALPSDACWHWLGALQRNKLKEIVPRVTLIHSFDRPEIAPALAALGARVLLQVNVGREPQKGGVAPEDARAAMEAATSVGLSVEGLMTIPPRDANPRPHFAALGKLRDELVSSFPACRELSMGMSADFEIAIEEGATIVRVGEGIFGAREDPRRG